MSMTTERRVHVILSTIDSEEKARDLARTWVTTQRAACVTALPGAHSTYRWKGELCAESEVVLLIKTAFATAEERDTLLAGFAADHPYEEPEVLVLDPSAGAPGYLAWVLSHVR